MKAIKTFFRSFRDAFKSVVRNFSLSLASVACITITLFIIAAALLVSENVRNFTVEIKKDVTIVAFLDSDITEEEIATIDSEIKNLDNINTYEFKSKAVVKNEMAQEYQELKEVLDDWDEQENPLKDSYTITVVEVERIKETASALENMENVNSVQYGEGLVERLLSIFDTIEKVTYIAALALILVTIFLIINTIKLTIFSRKREIGIMRLVGASNTRIKLPFVVEGVVLGIIGSVIPMCAIIFGYTAFFEKMGGVLFTSTIKLVEPTPFVFETSLILLAVGIIVGMLGSSRAVRRYIKV